MFLVHLFVCFVHVRFCHFSLPFGVEGWLRFVIVALSVLFYYHVCLSFWFVKTKCVTEIVRNPEDLRFRFHRVISFFQIIAATVESH